MPELPEVEIIKNNLSEYMIGNEFISIEVNTSKLRYKIPHNFDETIKNSKVVKIERIAKYIIIYLSNEFKILVHLGMTGNFLSSSQKINSLIINEDKHIHLRFFMTNDVIINYHDIRKFGFFKIISPDNLVLENLKNKINLNMSPSPTEMSNMSDLNVPNMNTSQVNDSNSHIPAATTQASTPEELDVHKNHNIIEVPKIFTSIQARLNGRAPPMPTENSSLLVSNISNNSFSILCSK